MLPSFVATAAEKSDGNAAVVLTNGNPQSTTDFVEEVVRNVLSRIPNHKGLLSRACKTTT